MKRLGMWNRLAVVAIVLTTLIAPTWIILAERGKIVETNSAGYAKCMEAAFKPDSDGTLGPKSCSEIWFPDDRWYPGWLEWWQTLGVILALCVITYLLAWAAVATVKWIWRGRQTA